MTKTHVAIIIIIVSSFYSFLLGGGFSLYMIRNGLWTVAIEQLTPVYVSRSASISIPSEKGFYSSFQTGYNRGLENGYRRGIQTLGMEIMFTPDCEFESYKESDGVHFMFLNGVSGAVPPLNETFYLGE